MGAYKQESIDNLLKVLIATDKFKGSLTSFEAANAIKKGLKNKNTNALYFDVVEIADGGDGSAMVLSKCCDKEGTPLYNEVECVAVNPLGRVIKTSYLINGKYAFIEMARISGLELLCKEERNPLYTTSYGVGELIKHAVESGINDITISIGGSATNDGGTGMLQALGFLFLDAAGNNVTDSYMCGKELERIYKIVPPDYNCCNNINVKVICDVTNPLLGENGATMVYGGQKGASLSVRQRLEAGMASYAVVANLTTGKNNTKTPGVGAAGGIGFAAVQFLEAELISGWKYFANITKLEQRVAAADIVISGEGKIDAQSVQGKVVDGVMQLAAKYGKPLMLFCGINETDSSVIKLSGVKIYAIADIEPNIEKSMKNAAKLLSTLAEKIKIT